MEGFIQKYGLDGIDLLYAHNDDMALGAIEAIEAAGGVPGEDIKIISIDAVKDGMQALVDGKINFIVECNPLLGELAAGLVTDVLDGRRRREEGLRGGPELHAGAGGGSHRRPRVLIHRAASPRHAAGRSSDRPPGRRGDNEQRKGHDTCPRTPRSSPSST